MSCRQVCESISDGDRRRLRGRGVRAHLRACPDCRAFAESIQTRKARLGAIAPMPAVLGAQVLAKVLGAGGGMGSGGGMAAGGGAAAGSALGATQVAGLGGLAKVGATLAVVAAAGVGISSGVNGNGPGESSGPAPGPAPAGRPDQAAAPAPDFADPHSPGEPVRLVDDGSEPRAGRDGRSDRRVATGGYHDRDHQAGKPGTSNREAPKGTARPGSETRNGQANGLTKTNENGQGHGAGPPDGSTPPGQTVSAANKPIDPGNSAEHSNAPVSPPGLLNHPPHPQLPLNAGPKPKKK
jgi:hypothetical protein